MLGKSVTPKRGALTSFKAGGFTPRASRRPLALSPGAVLYSSQSTAMGSTHAVLPAVNMPTPGGLSYEDIIEVLHAIAAKARIAGFILTELVPERDDLHNLSALTAARIVSVASGLIAGDWRSSRS